MIIERIFKAMVFFTIIAGLLSACQQKLQPEADTLEVTPTEISFAASGNEDAVLEVKSGTDWDYSADGWIVARKDGSKLVVNVSDNPEYSERSGKILFTAGSAQSVRVDVRQDARIESSLDLSAETIEAGSDGGVFEVSVTSAENWTVTGTSDWCTLSPTEGKSGDKIKVTVLANDSEEVRTAEFKVTSGTVRKTLTVISTPVYFMLLSDPASGEKSFDSAGGKFNVVLRTNISAEDISCTIDGGDGWVSARQSVTTSSGVTYEVTVSSNSGYVSRASSLTFSAEGVGKVTVYVSQAQSNYVKVTDPASGEYVLSTDAADISVIVRTNLYSQLSVSMPEWITSEGEPELVSQDSGLSDYRYRFNVASSAGSRTGNITFRYEQFEASVKVTQTSEDASSAVIPDPTFRKYLYDKGYIISADNEQVELTANGEAATSFDFSSYTYNKITTLEGIDAFSNLTELNLSNCNNIPVVDISGLHKVSSLYMGYCGYTESIILGDNPVTSLSYGWYTDVYVSAVSVSGSRLEALDVTNGYPSFGDIWSVLDVTGCPALKSISSQRPTSLIIYVTQEQKDSITNNGNGVLTVR